MTEDGPRRAALYLDFDNVFGALAEQDEWAAWEFANDPGCWLAWFAAGGDGGAPQGRRVLLRRCYLNAGGHFPLNPQGRLAQELGGPRAYYSRFRGGFVRAGFQVVDCPALTASGKNAADITMVLDIVDALAHPTRFDEFLILASDADFTPLLHRIRAHDRQVLVVTHRNTARAFRAATDPALDLADFADTALAWGEAAASPAPPEPPAPAGEPPMPATPEAQQAAILAAVRAALAESPGLLHLPGLGTRLRRVCGAWVGATRYGGAGSLQRLLEGAPGLALELGPGGGWLFDPARHARPSAEGAEQPDLPLPSPEPPPSPEAETAPARAKDAAAPLHAELPPGLVQRIGWLPGAVPGLLGLGTEGLGLLLDQLAGLLPLAPPRAAPEKKLLPPEAREQVRNAILGNPAAVAAGVGEAGIAAVIECLERGGFGWQAIPEAPQRLRRSFNAALLGLLLWGGTPLEDAEKAALRDWIGLAEGPHPPHPLPPPPPEAAAVEPEPYGPMPPAADPAPPEPPLG